MSQVDYKKALTDPRAFAEESSGKWLEREFGDAVRAAEEQGLKAHLQQSWHGDYLALCIGDVALVTATVHGDGDAVMSVRPTVKVPVHSRSEVRAVLCDVLAAYAARPKAAPEPNRDPVVARSWEHHRLSRVAARFDAAWRVELETKIGALKSDGLWPERLPNKSAAKDLKEFLQRSIAFCNADENSLERKSN